MPIYEYKCSCGNRFEEFRFMSERHDAVCSCGRKPILLISRPAPENPYRKRLPFTVYDGDGNVLSQRNDLQPTPSFHEYHPSEVLQRAKYGQEMAHNELLEEAKQIQDSKLARQV